MEQKVVVAVTDAAVSRRVVDWAVDRAAERGDRLELISVVDGAVGVGEEDLVVDWAQEWTEDVLRNHAERVRARGVPVEVRLDRGRPVERLIAASEDASLLVIGSDYRGTESRPARGPHGMRIAAGAHCPVVVVPDLDLTGRSGVVVGVDGSEASESAIAFAAADADRSGEALTAVSTWSPIAIPLSVRSYPEGYLRNMQTLTEEALGISMAGISTRYPDVKVRRVVESSERPETVVNRLASGARLCVIGSHGRGRLARFLLGSTSQQVLLRLATATVVVR
ncbi:nucleotide-binding universal stress UspA family protein [Microbacterium sp. AK009]|uniref:universal stress protein n=1 Tax=Microbacterium sp. AK009 TaxID=2723068 RepID=UPI0015CCB2F3|nr:universal stress protein [Microbacterium sp. AK009]NYF15686.1 nucleotide-binding universal stress UspA family protein [Microbacterium sp. AK009]